MPIYFPKVICYINLHKRGPMIKTLLRNIDRISPPKTIHAHCDIPCGIYDPHQAQVAAHTVLRMTDLLNEKKSPHDIARLTQVKEEHAEIVKHEVRIIWGDYIKPEHLEKFPDTSDLVFSIMKAASKTKQEVNSKAAEELLEKVQEFAEIFWETKGVQTSKVKSNYPTERELVQPK